MATAAKSFNSEDTRPLKFFFQDEARFGRMANPVRCWVPEGFRPILPMQRVREYLHVYSAVCPTDGDSFSLILPNMNTDMMNLYLEEFSLHYKDYRIVMAVDGASWHRAKYFTAFENIRLVFQPPYSPEVNPAEHLWEHIREKYLGNLYWTSLEKLEDALMTALTEITRDKETIRTLVGFQWALFNV